MVLGSLDLEGELFSHRSEMKNNNNLTRIIQLVNRILENEAISSTEEVILKKFLENPEDNFTNFSESLRKLSIETLHSDKRLSPAVKKLTDSIMVEGHIERNYTKNFKGLYLPILERIRRSKF